MANNPQRIEKERKEEYKSEKKKGIRSCQKILFFHEKSWVCPKSKYFDGIHSFFLPFLKICENKHDLNLSIFEKTAEGYTKNM